MKPHTFVAVSRTVAERENVMPPISHIIISIYTPGHLPANPVETLNTRAVLKLAFHDLDRMPQEGTATWNVLGGREIKLFDEAQANEIIDCMVDYTPEGVLVHCDVGASRSPAVAAALAKAYEGDDSHFFRTRAPNAWVFRIMIETLHKRGLL